MVICEPEYICLNHSGQYVSVVCDNLWIGLYGPEDLRGTHYNVYVFFARINRAAGGIRPKLDLKLVQSILLI